MADLTPATELDGDGPPLVAIGGLGDAPDVWDAVPLARRFLALRVGLAAPAGDGAPADDPAAHAAALAPVVREAFGQAPPLLVGHGFGALVAAALAARLPALAVVAVEQPLDPEALRERAAADGAGWAAAVLGEADLEDAVDALLAPLAALPVLAIRGVDGGDAASMWLRHRLPLAEVEQWPGGGRSPHLAEPSTFVRRLALLGQAAA